MHTVFAERLGETGGHGIDAAARRRPRHRAAGAEPADDGGDVDDPPLAPARHLLADMLAGEEIGLEPAVDRLVPIGLGAFEYAAVPAAGGGVQQDVDTAEFFEDVLCHRRHGVPLGDVVDAGFDPAPGLDADLFRDLFKLFRIFLELVEIELGALIGITNRYREPEALCSPGDNRGLVLQSHRDPPV